MSEQRDREGQGRPRQDSPSDVPISEAERRLEQIRREGFIDDARSTPLTSAPLTDSDAFMDPNARIDLSHVDPAQLAGNPFERKANWRNAFRGTGSRGWAAAALAVAVLLLGWNLRPASTPENSVTVAADGVVRLAAADPRALRQQIVTDLRAAGVDANGYEQLGVSGIDAELPRPLTPEARRALEQHRIQAPESGTLRIEISGTAQR